jgi:hypothetical protein
MQTLLGQLTLHAKGWENNDCYHETTAHTGMHTVPYGAASSRSQARVVIGAQLDRHHTTRAAPPEQPMHGSPAMTSRGHTHLAALAASGPLVPTIRPPATVGRPDGGKQPTPGISHRAAHLRLQAPRVRASRRRWRSLRGGPRKFGEMLWGRHFSTLARRENMPTRCSSRGGENGGSSGLQRDWGLGSGFRRSSAFTAPAQFRAVCTHAWRSS